MLSFHPNEKFEEESHKTMLSKRSCEINRHFKGGMVEESRKQNIAQVGPMETTKV